MKELVDDYASAIVSQESATRVNSRPRSMWILLTSLLLPASAAEITVDFSKVIRTSRTVTTLQAVRRFSNPSDVVDQCVLATGV